MNAEIFDSSVRSLGDLGGFFEYDGETAYFYLFDHRRPEGHKVVGAIHVTSKRPDFGKDDVRVEWDTSETTVGLLIKGELSAAFSADGKKYGGHYEPDARPYIPDAIALSFRTE